MSFILKKYVTGMIPTQVRIFETDFAERKNTVAEMECYATP